MANKDLGKCTLTESMLKTDSVLIEVGGSLRRIRLGALADAINSGDDNILSQIAWGVPLKQSVQSNPEWGRIGNLGLWEEYKQSCGRYLVTNNGKAAKLSSLNSGVYADGTELDESKGHIMTIFPRLYYRVKNDARSGIPTLWMSQHPIGGHYIEEMPLGAYLGSLAGGALTSRSGQSVAVGKTISDFWKLAQVNGSDWGLMSYDHFRLLFMLALSEYGNTNIQEKLGHGIGGSTSVDVFSEAVKLKTGATKVLGDGFGKIDIAPLKADKATSVNSSRVSLLGIEDPYNWYWTMVQGIFCGNSGNSAQKGTEVFIYQGNRMPTPVELTTHPSGDYRELTRLTTSGWIKELVFGDFFDLIPTVYGGDSNSYLTDYGYASATGQLFCVGAHANYGPNAGCVRSDSDYAFAYAYSHFAVRLAFYGELTYINGREVV